MKDGTMQTLNVPDKASGWVRKQPLGNKETSLGAECGIEDACSSAGFI